MSALAVAGLGLGAGFLLALLTWALSLPLRDVSIVDIAWSGLVLATAVVAAVAWLPGPRGTAVLVLALVWALRLSGHIAARHDGEDRRYQAIRARNQPGFAWKSLYLVFALQAVLGWIVSAPLVAAVADHGAWRWADGVGLGLAAFGLVFEAIADWQLTRFKRDPANRGTVMSTGLWRYSRHPNYFGEFCIWWGFWIVAMGGGAWWTVVSPILMSVLLLRVSGVTLLEQDIGERRPGYADYIARTNAFFPGVPRS